MKVLHIIQCTDLGGMEQAALLMTRLMIQRGHTCRLLSLNPIGTLGPLLEREGVPAVGLQYSGWGGWRSLLQMYRAFRAEAADALLMSGHNLSAMLALGGLCRGRRLLFIHYHHTGVKPAWQWRLIYTVARRRFNTVAFCSDFIRREAEGIYPALRRVSRTVRNPYVLGELPTGEERAEARYALGIPLGAPVIGNAGWLIERKRWDIFLHVARVVGTSVPDALFVIAGDGPERPALEALASQLGLKSRVRWLGWREDVASIYASLDVLLFNSDWDAAPRTPTEALAFGVPVVASVLHGGLNELISGPDFGFLIAAHDIEWLAERVIWLLRHGDMAKEMTAKARARLADIGSPERIVDQIEQFLS